MGGHSHWSQIKRQKGGKRRQAWPSLHKISREITVAAREGGGDPGMNPRLRLAIDKLATRTCPPTRSSAVERGTGSGDAANLQEVTFEGMVPAASPFSSRH